VRSLRARLTVWFGLGFLIIAAVFTFLTHHTLKNELEYKIWQKDYPTHPDWKLHGSFSEDEVNDITSELLESALVWSVPLVFIAIAGGYWMARHSLQPIVSVNRQLAEKNPGNLGEPIQLPEADEEFRDLLRQLNDLLARLDQSFEEMNNYAAKVAHELRTPLAIMRLKVEQSGNQISPELADELEGELHRLTHVVDQSLMIARADRGRIPAQRTLLNLSALMKDVLEDFQLLAAEQQRQFAVEAEVECWVNADPRHVRQITHNLLTNALKHGQGNLAVRVKKHGDRVVLFIANFVTRTEALRESTLGLGLRVVTALLRLDPEITFHRRHGNGYYAVHLNFLAYEPANYEKFLM